MGKVPKGYNIGVSSGLWSIEKKEGMLGIARKIEWVATSSGTTFTEVALDSMTEFSEPDLKEKVKRAVSLGMIFGMHGEAYATTGLDAMPLASALEADYARGHERLIQHIEGAGKIGAIYINMHTSESTPFILLEKRDLEVSKLVDFWGRPFKDFFEANPDIMEWASTIDSVMQYSNYKMRTAEEIAKENILRHIQTHEGKQPDAKLIEEINKQAEKEAKELKKEIMKTIVYNPHHQYGIEKVAYLCIAKWMMKNNDPLWQKIVGKKFSDKELEKGHGWVPAVAAKYIWGHFMQDLSKETPYKDPRPLLEKYKLFWSFETPMTTQGYEGHMRLSQLPHIYSLITSIDSEWIRFTVDMEHILGNNLDPEKQIKALPSRAAEKLLVVHLTVPHPLNPSHMPLQLASEAQYYIYQRLYELRQKGFKNGFFLFEIGKDGVKDSIHVMRL
ncbi:MAG: hypothetical protein GOV02_03425, partial [Candidatus Aenigmarchaeota archaeon]|nr:hypothetical protein [Candidatus Aenigmarchaeota archaeon]